MMPSTLRRRSRPLAIKTVDEDDRNMWEGLGILQLLAMEHMGTPDTTWSPLLQKIASSTEVSAAIAAFLLRSLNQKDI